MAAKHVSELSSTGDIVERQTYLNGARYYLVEGEADSAGERWSWTLAFTLPKDETAPIAEGDVSLLCSDRSWFGDIVGGSYGESIDEAVDAPVIEIRLDVKRRDEADNTENWPRASLTARIAADACHAQIYFDG